MCKAGHAIGVFVIGGGVHVHHTHGNDGCPFPDYESLGHASMFQCLIAGISCGGQHSV